MYVRRRGPLARIISLVVLVAALAIAGTRIRSALQASNGVDAEATRLTQLSQGRLGSSFLVAANFRRELSGVRGKLGAHAPMLEAQVSPTAVEFQYVVGQRAAGLTANSVQPRLVPEEVTLTGEGSPRSRAFSLSIVRVSVPPALVSAIRRKPGLSDFSLESATLEKQPADGRIEWSIVGTGGGRELVFTARPGGQHLRKVS
jgi:hypothetical protein